MKVLTGFQTAYGSWMGLVALQTNVHLFVVLPDLLKFGHPQVYLFLLVTPELSTLLNPVRRMKNEGNNNDWRLVQLFIVSAEFLPTLLNIDFEVLKTINVCAVNGASLSGGSLTVLSHGFKMMEKRFERWQDLP